MSKNRTLRGPDPDKAFVVQAGVVAVVGARQSVTLPAGVVWPGQAQLPAELLAWLEPAEVIAAPGSAVAPWVATPRDIEWCTALVQVQQLRASPHTGERLAQLDTLGLTDVALNSHVSLAALVGVTRESVSHAQSDRRRAARRLPPEVARQRARVPLGTAVRFETSAAGGMETHQGTVEAYEPGISEYGAVRVKGGRYIVKLSHLEVVAG